MVNAARVILDWPLPEGATYADQPGGIDPDREHPPLGKLVVAASMALFGDNPLGWRLPSLVAGLACIALISGIARTLSGEAWLALLASGLFALDNLALVHSRIARLDMQLVALMLLGAWFGVRRWYVAAGAACAAAALVEIRGVAALVALLLFEALHQARSHTSGSGSTSSLRCLSMAGTRVLMGFLPTWLGLWWLLDLGVSVYATPWDHLSQIVASGALLPSGGDSYPWQWFVNQVQTLYVRVDQQFVLDGEVVRSDALIYLRSAMNPVIIGAASVALLYAAWRAWRHTDPLATWSLVWFIVVYLPFLLAALLAQATAYLSDFLPAVPALAIAIALLLRHALPRSVTYAYVLAVVAGFVGYFPFHVRP